MKKDEFLRVFRTENESWQTVFNMSKNRELTEIKALRNYHLI